MRPNRTKITHLFHAYFYSDTEHIRPFPVFPKVRFPKAENHFGRVGTKSNQIYPLLSPSHFFPPPAKKNFLNTQMKHFI